MYSPLTPSQNHPASASLAHNLKGTVITVVDNGKLDRKCTDVACLSIYLLCLASLVGVYFGLKSRYLPFHTKPLDVDLTHCVAPYNYLYIPSMISKATVCVSICPMDPGVKLPCLPNSAFSVCPYSVAGLVRNEIYSICYVLGAKFPMTGRLRTYYNLIARH